MSVDPLALDQLLEQGAVKPAWAAIIDVLDAGLLTQFGVSQTRREPLVLPPRYFAIEQKPKPFVMAETVGFTGGGDVDEGLGHAMQAEGMKLIEGRMFEHVVSPNCSSAAHGCWNAGSALRPWRACARGADRDGC